MSFNKVSILGVEFINTTMDEMVNKLLSHTANKEKAFVVTANPEIALYAYENKNYRELLTKADYVTADGIGVVKAAGLLGQPLPERVTGFDMFMKLLEAANEQSYSIYLYGAKDVVLEKTIANIKKNYPNAKVVGSHHGYIDWENNCVADEIQKLKPDFVFLALGFPRQEQWVAKNIDKFDSGVFMGVGGSFDVLAGVVNRAPVVWQKLNVEWLYRLIQQPTRWRRMLALPIFMGKVLKQKVKGAK